MAIEEIEALSAIYGVELEVEDEANRAYSIVIKNIDFPSIQVKLSFKLPSDYPLKSNPTFGISSPYLKIEDKEKLRLALEEVYLHKIGESIIFECIEKIREKIPTLKLGLECQLKNEITKETKSPEKSQELTDSFKIFHGEIITDRKSSFQAHVSVVTNTLQVRKVINKLKENKKIQQATHNIYAYRICNKKNIISDYDNDGENQAGKRLLYLLETMDAQNVVVVVSRWYGGIQIGSDRFRHINNAAIQVLTSAKLIPIKGK